MHNLDELVSLLAEPVALQHMVNKVQVTLFMVHITYDINSVDSVGMRGIPDHVLINSDRLSVWVDL